MASPFFSSSVMYKSNISTGATYRREVRPALPGTDLLERVVELGSLRDAAMALGVGEQRAWAYLVSASNLSDAPLVRVEAENLVPTPYARGVLLKSDELARAFQSFLSAPRGGTFRQFHQRHQLLRRLAARTSARNQFYCRVCSLRRERVNATLGLDLGGGDRLTAHITRQSVRSLGLEWGSCCHALIDPAWVEVRTDRETRGDPQRNYLEGRVVRLRDDPVDGEVAIELAGGRIVLATMTRAEMREKGIRPGKPARALIQSSQIILAVDAPPDATPT